MCTLSGIKTRRSNSVSPIVPDVDEVVRQPEPQQNKDLMLKHLWTATMNGSLTHNHQMMLLQQILGAKTPPTMNNGGMQDRSPRLTEIKVMSIFLTPALTFLANGTSYIRQLSALSNN